MSTSESDDQLGDERPHVGGPEQGLDDASAQPIQVEQVRHEPVELPGVLGDAPREVAHLVLLELQVLARHRDGQPEDPRERRPEVVRHRLEERVLHLVDDAEPLRGLRAPPSGRAPAPGSAGAR